MNDWTPISRDQVEVEGLDGDRLKVVVTLTPEPPAGWGKQFECHAACLDPFYLRPRFRRGVIRMQPRDDELEDFTAAVDRVISDANADYVRFELGRALYQQSRAIELADRAGERLAAARAAAELVGGEVRLSRCEDRAAGTASG